MVNRALLGYNIRMILQSFEFKSEIIHMADDKPILTTLYKNVVLSGNNKASGVSGHCDEVAFLIFWGKDHYYHAFFEGIGEALLLSEMFPDKKIVPTFLYIDDIPGESESISTTAKKMIHSPDDMGHLLRNKLSDTNFEMYEIARKSFEKIIVIPTAYVSEFSFSEVMFVCKHLCSPLISMFENRVVNAEYESYPWYRFKIINAIRNAINHQAHSPSRKIFISRKSTSNRLRRMSMAVEMLKLMGVEFEGYTPVSDPNDALSLLDPDLRIRINEEMEHYDQRLIGLKDEVQLESIFEELGFEIILLEGMSLQDQVAVLASASVIAGLSGAGLFTSAFSVGKEATAIVIEVGADYGFNYRNMLEPVTSGVTQISLQETSLEDISDIVKELL